MIKLGARFNGKEHFTVYDFVDAYISFYDP